MTGGLIWLVATLSGVAAGLNFATGDPMLAVACLAISLLSCSLAYLIGRGE